MRLRTAVSINKEALGRFLELPPELEIYHMHYNHYRECLEIIFTGDQLGTYDTALGKLTLYKTAEGQEASRQNISI